MQWTAGGHMMVHMATHLSTVGGVSLTWHLPLHLPRDNQEKLWLLCPPIAYTDKLEEPIRAQGRAHITQCSLARPERATVAAAKMEGWANKCKQSPSPAQTSSHLTWWKPSEWAPPPDTAAPCRHASPESEERERKRKKAAIKYTWEIHIWGISRHKISFLTFWCLMM